LTKFLGEEVCRFAVRNWHMHVNVLRLCWPLSIEDWQAQAYRGTPTPKTSADDLARALLAALQFRQGYQLFNLSGDYDLPIINLRKAKHLLHWAPLARPIKVRREKISRRVIKRSLRRWLAKFGYAVGLR
jgi:hypothetical protein